jgi:hypothetical protein
LYRYTTIQDQQSKELSQVNVERRAKKLKLAEQEVGLYRSNYVESAWFGDSTVELSL